MATNSVSTKDLKSTKALIEGDSSELTYRTIERLAEDVANRMSKPLSGTNQQAVKLLTYFLKDTIEFIYKSFKSSGKVSQSQVTAYVLSKHKNLFAAVGFDHGACGVAVAQLIVHLTTAVPVMSMEVKALVITTGMAVSGVGIPFAIGSASLLVLSALSVYLSASQTADVCSGTISTLATQLGDSRYTKSSSQATKPAQLRCEVPINQFPSHLLGMLGGSLAKGSKPLFSPLRQ